MNPERPATDSPARTNNKRPGRTIIDSSSSSDPAASNNDNNDEDENERRKRLFGLFRKFDQGGTGILQLEDVHAMVKAIMIPGNRSSKMKTKQVASVILQSLDKDKSGGVDREEFVQWVTKGNPTNEVELSNYSIFGGRLLLWCSTTVSLCQLRFACMSFHSSIIVFFFLLVLCCPFFFFFPPRMLVPGAKLTPEQRVAFGQSGPVQASILDFLEAVEGCLLNKPTKQQKNRSPDDVYDQDAAVDDVVDDLYSQFDVDNDGHIERDELCAMLMEVCLSGGMSAGYEETYEAAEKVMMILDTDNSGRYAFFFFFVAARQQKNIKM